MRGQYPDPGAGGIQLTQSSALVSLVEPKRVAATNFDTSQSERLSIMVFFAAPSGEMHASRTFLLCRKLEAE